MNVMPVEPAMRMTVLKEAKSRCVPPYGPSISARCVLGVDSEDAVLGDAA